MEKTQTLCKNAFAGLSAWFCFHWNGRALAEDKVNEDGLCFACATAKPPYEEAPSFMKGDED